MDSEEKLIDLLEGNLSLEETQLLNETINNNAGLKADKEMYEKILVAIVANGQSGLRKELDTYLEDHIDKNTSKGKVIKWQNVWLYSGIAATIVVGVFYINGLNQSSSNGSIQLNSDPVPIHADSALYHQDSIKLYNKANPQIKE